MQTSVNTTAPRIFRLARLVIAISPILAAAATVSRADAQLAGDECSNAIVAVAGANGPVANTSYTLSANPPENKGECQFLNWTSFTRDVWWVFDAPVAGKLTLEFCASNFDTSVVVYRGSCGALERIGCDDDACAPAGPLYQSKIDNLAIDSGKVTPESTYVDTGRVVVGTYPITNWDFSANGRTTVRQYLQKSLNTGSVWLAQSVGAKDFYRYLDAFGLREQTHIGLAGEAEGLMRLPSDPNWYPVDLATNSYGQGLAVTPLQMLTALNVFANGGRLMRPYVVSRIVTGEQVRTFQPVEVRRPVSAQTANTVGALMHDVVDNVELHGAQTKGYEVAGKTGTTLVSIPTGYDLDSTIASFAGFIPYQHPRVSVLVKIDQPTGGLNLGGQVAAPVFAKVAADVMHYYGIAPAIPVTPVGAAQAAAR